MKYFMQTTRFYPNSHKDFGLEKLENGLYLMKEDNSLWKERKLYDLGWGKEKGFCRLPELSFDELIQLAFVDLDKFANEKTYNYWGAVSVLLEDYCEPFINHIKENYLKDSCFAKQYAHVFKYVDAELNIPDNLINRLGDKTLSRCCVLWKEFVKQTSLFSLKD